MGGVGRGKLTYVKHLVFPSCVYGDEFLIKVKTYNWAPYVAMFLKSKFGKQQIERFTSGAASPTLDKDELEKILVMKPSRELARKCREELLNDLIRKVEEIIEGKRKRL